MKQSKFLTYFTQKHKISMRRVRTGDEIWHFFTSRGKLLLLFVALFSLTVFSIVMLIIYTPIVDTLPGNIGQRQRDMLISSIFKIDSLNREVVKWQDYTQELKLVLDGGFDKLQGNANDSVKILQQPQTSIVPKSPLDSLLRSSFLTTRDEMIQLNNVKRKVSFDMITPVQATVTKGFDPDAGNFGVVLNPRSNSVVLSVLDGTVILSSWSPNDGYTVGVQHSASVLTFYKGLKQSIKEVGSSVRAGEGIGITDEISNGKKVELRFEMWNSGNAVDPENFIHFSN